MPSSKPSALVHRNVAFLGVMGLKRFIRYTLGGRSTWEWLHRIDKTASLATYLQDMIGNALSLKPVNRFDWKKSGQMAVVWILSANPKASSSMLRDSSKPTYFFRMSIVRKVS